MLEDALEVATDPDFKFDLAVQLGKLDVAKVINFSYVNLVYYFYRNMMPSAKCNEVVVLFRMMQRFAVYAY